MGVTLRTTEQIRTEQGQVTCDGVYTLGRNRFRIQAGDVLPEGAVLDPLPGEHRSEQNESILASATYAPVTGSVTDSDEYKALLTERDRLQADLDTRSGEATLDVTAGDPGLTSLLIDLGLATEGEDGTLVVDTEGVGKAAADSKVLIGAVDQLVRYLNGESVPLETESEETVNEPAKDQQPTEDPAKAARQEPTKDERMKPAAPENRALQGAPTTRRRAKKDDDR
jgi:hypothetical protein